MYGSFLSPIFDYTDIGFRMLCQRYGASATCIPLVNSTAIARDRSKVQIIDAHPDEKNIGVQIVGSKPDEIADACREIYDSNPFISWLNINCGCSSNRTRDYGGGSALLENPEKIALSIQKIKKGIDIPVSVKMRIKNTHEQTLSVCNRIKGAGADFLIIHGRTPWQGYQGKCDWEQIKIIKGESNIPVVGNGDIKSASHGDRLVQKGYCDSYMMGRIPMRNPMAFCNRKVGSVEKRFGLLEEYLELFRKYKGEPALKDVKVKALNFIHGLHKAGELRNKIYKSESLDSIMRLKDQYINP